MERELLSRVKEKQSRKLVKGGNEWIYFVLSQQREKRLQNGTELKS